MIFKINDDKTLTRINVPLGQSEEQFLQGLPKDKYIQVDPKDLPVSNFYHKPTYKIADDGNIIIDEEKSFEVWIEQKKEELRKYIETRYPEWKQRSDIADKFYFETYLRFEGIENLEQTIVELYNNFINGIDIENDLAQYKDKNIRAAIVQLIKVAVRVGWVQMCKQELSRAIQEKREMAPPPYPNAVDDLT